MIPNPNTLSLQNLVDVIVEISSMSAPRATFNQLLVLGITEGIISKDQRVALYQSTEAMIQDGYVDTDPEYICAEIYFSQSPRPLNLIIGFKGSDETYLEAFEACRMKNFDWYIGFCPGAVDEDHKALALYSESCQPSTIYAYTTQSTEVRDGVTSPLNIGAYLQQLKYSRTIGQYSTEQGNVYPNNIYAIVAAMGYACGQNSGLANSAFSLMFKQEVGISTEPLSSTEVNNISGLGADQIGVNVNVYLSYGNFYEIFQKGVMANGRDFYETVGLDMLANDIQLNVMDLLTQRPKIPQTDPGVTQVVHQVNQACDTSVLRGFLAPGIWNGADILNLKNGDTLPNGYLVQSQPVSVLTVAEIDAGKIPPIYVAVKLAGAIKYVIIRVDVSV